MRICHACQRELDEKSLTAGRCAHCNAKVRKLSQRSIDIKRLVRGRKGNKAPADEGPPTAQETYELGDPDVSDVGATIELTPADTAHDEPAPPAPPARSGRPSDTERKRPTIEDRTDLTVEFTPPQSETSGAPEPTRATVGDRTDRTIEFQPPPAGETGPPRPKTPTIGDRSDMTIEFQPPSDDALRPTIEVPPTGNATHTFEQDLTIDLDLSPADEARLDSQWRATLEPGTRQGQTIRQKETVTGFRSSLPVKSRYVRERRTAGSVPPKTPAEVPDYELLEIIGEGGMGVVYAAHQSSIARTVAVKMLKPSAKVREDQRDKFISEAVVTGELDHPNIVPIYDLGSNEEGALFYSMKRVRGTPWDKVLNQKQLDENLSILLRVADAVAFAHAGGVIHRDLKPENVMLGDYGEVLVMDWGLARITPEFAHVDAIFQPDNLGGTPAYMAPEMARGPVESINKTSDIYLLGAILYEIIGGQPPHSGRDVMQCLMAASQNRIDPIRYDGELKEVALKAMATQQDDRYATVKEFQEAIRNYQSHSESLVLTAHANQNLQKARAAGDYQLFARALYGFQEALALWDANQRARTLLADTQRDYAQCAFGKSDFDLAASLLDAGNAQQQSLLEKINAARAERDARQRRLLYFKRAVAAMLVVVVATITTAFFRVRAARNEAVRQKDIAEEQRGIAVEQRTVADQQRAIAVEQSDIAKQERDNAQAQERIAAQERDNAQAQEKIAVEQRGLAEEAKRAEEYEAYVAEIGLAAAKINDNAYNFALDLLKQSKPELRNWEWGRLVHLSQLGSAVYKLAAPVQAVAYSPDGNSIASGDMAGKLTVRDAATGEVRYEVPHGQYVLAVAYSRDGQRIATGSSDRTIQIVEAASGNVLRSLAGHTDGVLTVRFSPDGRQLVSGSYDNTARLWSVETGEPLQTLQGHSWWVWAAEFSPDARQIVTAGQDGKAIVWARSEGRGVRGEERGASGERQLAVTDPTSSAPRAPLSTLGYTQLTEFTGHDGAVYSASFAPQGNLVVTGGYDGQVMIWNPQEVRPVDIERRLNNEPEPKSNHVVLVGHDKPVRSVAFSPNGQLVVSGSEDNSIRVWDARGGAARKVLRGHGSAVRSCTFSPDGSLVLSGGEDQSVRVWNVEGYQEIRVLHAKVFSGHADAVLAARFSRDGRQIVTASRDRTAALWDAATGRPIHHFQEGHEFLVSGAAFFPDRKRLATGAGDNSIRIWDLTAGTQLSVLSPTGRVGTLAVSPDGKLVVSGSLSNSVQVWDADRGKLAATLSGHEAEVSALAFSPAGDRLASGDDRGVVRIWRKQSSGATNALRGSPDPALIVAHSKDQPQQPASTFNDSWVPEHELTGHNGAITAVRFTPDGTRLVVASGDRTCGQWDVATGQELRALVLKHPDWVSSLDISHDGTRAVTTCDDGIARLWRLADAAPLASVRAANRPFNAASISADGSTAVLTSAEDRRVWLWDLSAASAAAASPNPAAQPTDAGQAAGDVHLTPLVDFNQTGGEVWSAMFAPGGRHVLTIGGNDAQLWNIDTRTTAVRYSPHGAVAAAALSPDGRLVATGSWDHSAKLWDAATGRAMRKLDGGHTGYINAVEFSPDGRLLLTASDDGTARLWDIASGKPTGLVLRGHAGRITSASFSADGARILTTSGDKTARIWDTATGREVKVLTGHEWAVLCGRFSPDGQRVITGSEDDTARIWNLAADAEPRTLAGHTAAITSVAFSPDGSRVLTGSQDNSARLWDSQTGKEILSLPGHTQEVTSVSFSPDGLQALTASRDGTAIIWYARDWHDPSVAALQVGE